MSPRSDAIYYLATVFRELTQFEVVGLVIWHYFESGQSRHDH
ncbi:MAG: hypothetical protein OEM48_10135 [Gammaproteobacteria bacterium]|nr:hypothetical protein [Gammaproteobacteria bacterium]MDH3407261.1 hypothetical protein [Gammaproteobacteria bacterium]MDH5487989.1 hypothetical protein [Gammaproteobacteria bacterium]